MLKVIDKKNYRRFKGRKLATVYRYKSNEWRCTTPKGAYVHIIYKGGIVALTGANSEYEIGQNIFLLASTIDLSEDIDDEGVDDEILDYIEIPEKQKYPKISFQDIMDFMDWECEPEQIWDACY